MSSMETAEIFSPGGLLENTLPGYESRPGQRAYAVAVAEAIERKEPIVVEGPCGTGKTIGYLVPAILSRGQVVICTENIALQQQIIEKDIPALQRAIDPFPSYALLKGRGNFICQCRMSKAMNAPWIYADPVLGEQMKRIEAKVDAGIYDKSGMGFVPDPKLWADVSGSDECDSCRENRCPYFIHREMASRSRVIITNYHMYFAHLAMREINGTGFLPDIDVLICDEGHKMADVCRNFHGDRVTPWLFAKLQRDLEACEKAYRMGGNPALPRQPQIIPAADALFRGIARYAEHVEKASARDRAGGTYRIQHRTWMFKEAVEAAASVVDGLDVLQDRFLVIHNALRGGVSLWSDAADGKRGKKGRSTHDDATLLSSKASFRCAKIALSIRLAVLSPDPNRVYWVEMAKGEHDKKRPWIIDSRPIDVSGYLHKEVWSKTPTPVVTSATLSLATGRSASPTMEYIRDELGVGGGRDAFVESPFDFQKNMLLIVPEMKNAYPKSGEKGRQAKVDAWRGEASRALQRILRMTGGVLGLFTSYQDMEYVAALCAEEAPLVQGRAPRRDLVARFSEDPSSSLFGVASFWQGVDVPGESLSVVVIFKLPFAVQDPIQEAREDLAKCHGKNPFSAVALPEAALQFKQGVGRLIRAKSDRGVVVVLDTRIARMGYGSAFLHSIPACRRTRDIGEIARFLAGAGVLRGG